MNPVTNSTAVRPPTPAQGSWLGQLSGPERATLFATFGGWALDGMDVMVYSPLAVGRWMAWTSWSTAS